MTHLGPSEFYPHDFLAGVQRRLALSVVRKMGDMGLRVAEGHFSSQVEVSLKK